jgi:hypothetical protein
MSKKLKTEETVTTNFKRYRYPASAIGRALAMADQGYSTREISEILLKKAKVKVSHKTVWVWINTFYIDKVGVLKRFGSEEERFV